MTERLEFALASEPGEYRRASRQTWRHRRRSTLRIAFASCVAGALVAAAAAYLGETESRVARALLFFALVSSFSFVGSVVGDYLQWQWQLRSSLRELRESAIPPRMSIGPGSARITHDDGEIELKWSAFSRVVRAEGVVLLYCAPKMAWYVSEAAVTAEEFAQVLEWIRSSGHVIEDVRQSQLPGASA